MPLTYFAKYHACPGFLPISPGPISPPNPLAAATTGDLVASALPSPAPPGASGFVTRGDAISPSLLSPPPRRTPHLLLKHFPSRCYPWRPSSPSIIFAPYSAQPLLSVRSGCCRLACPQRPQCRCFRAQGVPSPYFTGRPSLGGQGGLLCSTACRPRLRWGPIASLMWRRPCRAQMAATLHHSRPAPLC